MLLLAQSSGCGVERVVPSSSTSLCSFPPPSFLPLSPHSFVLCPAQQFSALPGPRHLLFPWPPYPQELHTSCCLQLSLPAPCLLQGGLPIPRGLTGWGCTCVPALLCTFCGISTLCVQELSSPVQGGRALLPQTQAGRAVLAPQQLA